MELDLQLADIPHHCIFFITVKLDSLDTPPPLHFSPVTSEQERSSTADTTPVGTPKTFQTFRRRTDKDYYRRGTSYVDSALLESDSDDTFPLFNDSDMASMNFHPRRPQTSNLTSALKSSEAQAMNISNDDPPNESFSTQPISMNRQRPRRESLAGSMVSGMSFGGVSVGSFVRDEYDTCVLM